MKHLPEVPFTRTRTDEWYNSHMKRNLHSIIEDTHNPVTRKRGLLEETRDELTLDLLQLELELIGVGKG